MPDENKYKYLTAQIDVPTGEDAPPSAPGQPANPKPTKRVGPGLLSELGLTDEQVEKLPRGLVRSATADEIRAGDQAAQTREAREIQTRAAADQRDAQIENNTERQSIIDDFERQKNEALAQLDARQEKARTETAARTTDELNKAQADAAAASTARTARRSPVNTQGGDQGTTAGGAASTTTKAPGTPDTSSASSAVPKK